MMTEGNKGILKRGGLNQRKHLWDQQSNISEGDE